MDDGERLVSVSELTERLQLTRITLLNWEKNGRMPKSIRLGGPKRKTKRWRASEIDEWIAGGCKPVS